MSPKITSKTTAYGTFLYLTLSDLTLDGGEAVLVHGT